VKKDGLAILSGRLRQALARARRPGLSAAALSVQARRKMQACQDSITGVRKVRENNVD
jgi:hypothetical protein